MNPFYSSAIYFLSVDVDCSTGSAAEVAVATTALGPRHLQTGVLFDHNY